MVLRRTFAAADDRSSVLVAYRTILRGSISLHFLPTEGPAATYICPAPVWDRAHALDEPQPRRIRVVDLGHEDGAYGMYPSLTFRRLASA